jgi:hypothetical protein
MKPWRALAILIVGLLATGTVALCQEPAATPAGGGESDLDELARRSTDPTASPMMRADPIRTAAVLVLLLLARGAASAQGDGPRSYLPAPIGVSGIAAKYLHLTQNLAPSGDVFVRDADITVDIFPTTLFTNFGLWGRPASLQGMFNPGHVQASFDVPGAPVEELSTGGFSDGYAAFKMGLVGTPALNAIEFSKYPMQFTLSGYFRLWISGSYDRDKLLNLGTNRTSFDIGPTLAIPLNQNRLCPTWLEVYPHVIFFTDNDDPTTRLGEAERIEQAPLFVIENHLSHNFTPKFWASLDVRFQYGADTTTDGVDDDNRIELLGGGPSVGYQFTSWLGANVSYGRRWAGTNGVRSELVRLTVVVTHIEFPKKP